MKNTINILAPLIIFCTILPASGMNKSVSSPEAILRNQLNRFDCNATMPSIATIRSALRSGANPNLQSRKGNTPLMIAVVHDPSLVQELMALGVNLDIQNNEGDSAFLIAVGLDYADTANLLVNSGASINISNKKGETAVYLARSNENEDLFNFLISQTTCNS